MRYKTLLDNEYIRSSLVLILLLNLFFFPVIWGNRTLMTSVRDVRSILPSGAYGELFPDEYFLRSPDSFSPAWFSEPYFKIIYNIYVKEKTLPLWNPYSAFGAPLAADMLSQPFYPLTIVMTPFISMKIYDLYIIFRLFIAGIFAFFYLRLFVKRYSALFGSIAFMFSGYFILYINIAHLSVEILLPAVFYAFEILLRKKDIKSMIFSSVIIFLTIVGGMPESTFMILMFAYVYFLFRVLTDISLKKDMVIHIRHFILSNMFGFFLSAFQLIPFLEFMRNSFNVHEESKTAMNSGLIYYSDWRILLLNFLPLASGPLDKNILLNFDGRTPLDNYWAIIPYLFSVIAVISYFRLKKNSGNNHIRLNVIFFSLSIVFLIMKYYGVPPVNWIGYLPLFSMILFNKYMGPLLCFAFAVLSATGFSSLEEQSVNKKYYFYGIVATLTTVIVLAVSWLPMIIPIVNYSYIFYWNILAGFVLIFISGILIFLYGNMKYKKCISFLLFILLISELFFNFIFPCFYSLSKLPLNKNNPYNGAPYIDFLKDNNKDYSRVFGREGVLCPNWSGVFGIYDVRFLNALMFNRYRTFVRSFLLDEDKKEATYGDLVDSFTGDSWNTGQVYNFESLEKKRFLQLSSVKYILTMTPYEDKDFVKIYDREVKIYEVKDIIPRASVFYGCEVMDGRGEDILKRLKDRSFNIFEKVIVSSEDVSGNDKDCIEKVSKNGHEEYHKADITDYKPQKIIINAQLEKSGILVINDSNYPGWNVYVDGKKSHILKVNYLFKGVLLDGGKHKVEFAYEPLSFYGGAVISFLTLISIMILLIFNRKIFPPNCNVNGEW